MHFMKLCLVLLLGARSGDLDRRSHLSGLAFTYWRSDYPSRSGTGAAAVPSEDRTFPGISSN